MYLQNNNTIGLYNRLKYTKYQPHTDMLQCWNEFTNGLFLNVKRGVDGEMRIPLAYKLNKTVSLIKNLVMSA